MNLPDMLRTVLPVVIAAFALAPLAGCGGDDDAPKIPHAVASTDDSSCLTCHKDGANGAPKAPHPDRSGCAGCHKR